MIQRRNILSLAVVVSILVVALLSLVFIGSGNLVQSQNSEIAAIQGQSVSVPIVATSADPSQPMGVVPPVAASYVNAETSVLAAIQIPATNTNNRWTLANLRWVLFAIATATTAIMITGVYLTRRINHNRSRDLNDGMVVDAFSGVGRSPFDMRFFSSGALAGGIQAGGRP